MKKRKNNRSYASSCPITQLELEYRSSLHVPASEYIHRAPDAFPAQQEIISSMCFSFFKTPKHVVYVGEAYIMLRYMSL